MSDSFKRQPAGGITTARSDKWSKAKAHRALRCAERAWLVAEEPLTPDPVLYGVSDEWKFSKDGHRWFGNHRGLDAKTARSIVCK